jgi:hypothetical protein
MKTFDSDADFENYLESCQDPNNLTSCQPVILPEDIKYKGRGTEEMFEKGYIICSCGKFKLDYCINCGENARKLKEAGGKIKEMKKGRTMKEILEEKRLKEASK